MSGKRMPSVHTISLNPSLTVTPKGLSITPAFFPHFMSDESGSKP